MHMCSFSYSEGRGGQITWAQEAEAAVSRDHTIALQPGQEGETVSKEKKMIKRISPLTPQKYKPPSENTKQLYANKLENLDKMD